MEQSDGTGVGEADVEQEYLEMVLKLGRTRSKVLSTCDAELDLCVSVFKIQFRNVLGTEKFNSKSASQTRIKFRPYGEFKSCGLNFFRTWINSPLIYLCPAKSLSEGFLPVSRAQLALSAPIQKELLPSKLFPHARCMFNPAPSILFVLPIALLPTVFATTTKDPHWSGIF